jgi:hypothetical protein
VYKSQKGKSYDRVKEKIQKRKRIKSKYITPLIEHETLQKETLFKKTTIDFCFYKRPTFDLKMVMEVKKETKTGLTTYELEVLLKHQVIFSS